MFIDHKVTLESARGIPPAAWSLPEQQYIRLGCEGCPKQVCLVAKNITAMLASISNDRDGALALEAITDPVPNKTVVWKGFEKTYGEDDSCQAQCANEPYIADVVNQLNDHFGSELQLPASEPCPPQR